MDIVICIPKTVPWKRYQFEIRAAEDRNEVLNYRVSRPPKNLNPGDRCYIVHDGILCGWMEVCGIVKAPSFKCSTTGQVWPEGYYIQRTGKFHSVAPKKIQSFRGYRYWFPDCTKI